MRVLGPDAAILAEIQDEVTNQGQEDVELVATETGTYTLSITPAPGIITSGAYASSPACR